MPVAARQVTVHLRQPHPRQAEFINSPAKRKIIRAGRRSGKTVGVAIDAVKRFLDGRRVLYAAPTSEQTDRFWFEVCRSLAEPVTAGVYKLNQTERVIERTGTQNRIRAKTAWSPDTLRGDYADRLILDEWQLMDEDTWEVVGAPMLVDNNGDAVFIYTPPSLRSAGVSKAHDPRHAAKMYKAALADTSGRWAAFHFTTHNNPYISQAGLAEIMSDMSRASYRQEILAEDDEAAAGDLVYGAFNESLCKVKRFDIPATWPVYSGHDFGSANPAALFLARVKLPLPPGAPAHLRYGDLVAFREYLPGAGKSTAINVDAFREVVKGRTVAASAGGSHQEDETRQGYGAHGWHIQEPPIVGLRPQIDRVTAIMEANRLFVFDDLLSYIEELMSCVWQRDREGNRTNVIDGEARYHINACARYILSLPEFRPESVTPVNAQVMDCRPGKTGTTSGQIVSYRR